MPMPRDLGSFAEFWPHYLAEHTCPRCRFVHYLAAASVVTLLVTAVVTGNGWWLLLVPVAAYGLAWLGHFVFERNRPATWMHPWWSLRAEWRMVFLACTGRLSRHLPRTRR